MLMRKKLDPCEKKKKCLTSESKNRALYRTKLVKIYAHFQTVNINPPRTSTFIGSRKLYCSTARVHCYYYVYIILPTNPMRRSEELLGDPFQTKTA